MRLRELTGLIGLTGLTGLIRLMRLNRDRDRDRSDLQTFSDTVDYS